MIFDIEVKKSVFKALKKISASQQIKILRVIKGLSKNPHPKNCLKLAGSSYYRVRCGDYRIIYDIQDQKLVIIVLKVGHRKDIYSE